MGFGSGDSQIEYKYKIVFRTALTQTADAQRQQFPQHFVVNGSLAITYCALQKITEDILTKYLVWIW